MNQPTRRVTLQKKTVRGGKLQMRAVYVTVFTNGYTKILRIDNKPPMDKHGHYVEVG